MSEATLIFTVTSEDTAVAVGSGSLEVLGTPRLLAWCEAATCEALASSLGEGETSVGTRVTMEHTAASAVGVDQRRSHLERGADDGGGCVLERHPGPHTRLTLAEGVLERRAGRGLAPREQARGAEHLQRPAADGSCRVLGGDGEGQGRLAHDSSRGSS